MASLVTDTVDDPKAGEMWTKKNPDAEDDAMNTVFIEGIEGDDVIYKSYQSYLDNDDYGASQTGIDEFLSLYSKEDELDLDDFEFLPNSYNDDDFLGIDELLDDTTEMISARDNNNNNNNKNFSDFDSGEDSSNDDDDSGGEKKKLTITLKKKKRPPNTVKTTIKFKRVSKESPTTSEPTIKRRRKPKEFRGGKYKLKGKNPYTRTETKYINWTFSMNDDTLFYPIYKDQVVPQVMTITKVEKKRYIFELKGDDNIDDKIERWSEWRRDFNSVNSWVQQIQRIINKCKNDDERNFLEALRRSFTITKKVYRTNEEYPTFKIEMAVCYVHFIKNKGTDHTWPTFREYFLKDTTNCGALKNIYEEIKKKKEEKNIKDKKKVPTRGTSKFASNAFLDSLESADPSFKVLNTIEKQRAKEALKAIIGTIVNKRVAQNATLLMAKLKF